MCRRILPFPDVLEAFALPGCAGGFCPYRMCRRYFLSHSCSLPTAWLFIVGHLLRFGGAALGLCIGALSWDFGVTRFWRSPLVSNLIHFPKAALVSTRKNRRFCEPARKRIASCDEPSRARNLPESEARTGDMYEHVTVKKSCSVAHSTQKQLDQESCFWERARALYLFVCSRAPRLLPCSDGGARALGVRHFLPNAARRFFFRFRTEISGFGVTDGSHSHQTRRSLSHRLENFGCRQDLSNIPSGGRQDFRSCLQHLGKR